MADGVDKTRAVGAVPRDVTAIGSAFRRSGREGLGSAPRPPAGGLRVFSGGITPREQEERGGGDRGEAAAPAQPRPNR